MREVDTKSKEVFELYKQLPKEQQDRIELIIKWEASKIKANQEAS